MLLAIKPDFNLNALLAALSPLNPEKSRPQLEVIFDDLRKAGLDVPDED